MALDEPRMGSFPIPWPDVPCHWWAVLPAAQPHVAMPASPKCSKPPRMPPAAYCNAACVPWQVMFPPGEGWDRSISVTCTEKEVL